MIDFESGYANPAMARMFGVSLEQTLGRRLLEDSPAFREDETFETLRTVVETVVDRAGPIGPLSGTFEYRSVPFGPEAVMNVVIDITAQRRLEAELARYAEVAAHDLREPLMTMGLSVV